jgi:hypothetical protein
MFQPTNPFFPLEEPAFRAVCQTKALMVLCRQIGKGVDADAASGLELMFDAIITDLEEMRRYIRAHISAA